MSLPSTPNHSLPHPPTHHPAAPPRRTPVSRQFENSAAIRTDAEPFCCRSRAIQHPEAWSSSCLDVCLGSARGVVHSVTPTRVWRVQHFAERVGTWVIGTRGGAEVFLPSSTQLSNLKCSCPETRGSSTRARWRLAACRRQFMRRTQPKKTKGSTTEATRKASNDWPKLTVRESGFVCGMSRLRQCACESGAPCLLHLASEKSKG